MNHGSAPLGSVTTRMPSNFLVVDNSPRTFLPPLFRLRREGGVMWDKISEMRCGITGKDGNKPREAVKERHSQVVGGGKFDFSAILWSPASEPAEGGKRRGRRGSLSFQ